MATTATASSTVSQNQFLQLMVKQLQSQDPLNPQDSGQMLAQLAQFSTLSGMEQLNASFSQMLTLQQITQGSNLIGKEISYTDSSGNAASGAVQSVGVTDGQVILSVNNAPVQLGQVTGVSPAS